MNDIVIIREEPDARGYMHYDFDSLRHGDAIEVSNRASAQEMFRRWRMARNHPGRLIASYQYPRLLYFFDDTAIV